jgi:DNA polymerase-3 subunit delta'
MRFSDVIGLDKQKAFLISGVQSNRIAHAQFFEGPRGSGNLALALAYIQYIHCSDKSSQDSCGVCTNCKQFANLVYPDLRLSFPYYGSKSIATDFYADFKTALDKNSYMDFAMWAQWLDAENKKLNIPALEMKQMAQHMNLQPFSDGYKVQLIWMPEFLGAEANMLLKLIEEPPENSLFILVGESAENVLTTIKSRTQITRIPPIDNQSMVQHLERTHELDADGALRIAAMCGGDYLLAQELLDNSENEYLEPFIQWLRLVIAVKRFEMISFSESIGKKGRVYQKGFLHYALEILRSTLLWKEADVEPGFSEKESEFIRKLRKVIDLHVVEEALSLISDSLYSIDRNINQKLIFNTLSHHMMAVFGKKRKKEQATNTSK